jgi:hypothetical protein
VSALIRKRNVYQDAALSFARARQPTFRPMSVVYFVAAPEAEAIKVGITKQIDRRFSTLQMASPFALTLLGVVPGGIEHEQRIQLLFRREHMRGEWFRDHGNLRSFIDAVLKLPEAERTEYVEREPSVSSDICRPEAEAEATKFIENTLVLLAEEIGVVETCKLYLRAWLR